MQQEGEGTKGLFFICSIINTKKEKSNMGPIILGYGHKYWKARKKQEKDNVVIGA